MCQLVHGLPVGGAEVMVDRLVRWMSRSHRVLVACLDEVGELGEGLKRDGFRVELLGRRPGFDWGCVRRLSRLLRAERVELVHAHQCTPLAYALATRAFVKRPPVLLTEHGRFFPDPPSLKRKCFHRLMVRPRDRYVAVGEAVRDALVDNERLPRDRTEVIYNGIDLSRLDAAHCRNEVRSELGVSHDEFLVFHVARLDPIKDHTTAIKAIAAARRESQRVRLMIVGEGPERERIETLVERQQPGGAVTLLGLRRDVPRLLAAADALLLTSVSEGIPVTIIEAMAAGKAVVSTDVGGVGEVVRHEQTGLLAPSGDAEGLARCLGRLAADRDLAARLAAAAAADARERFSEETMLARYDAIYRAMITSRAEPA